MEAPIVNIFAFTLKFLLTDSYLSVRLYKFLLA